MSNAPENMDVQIAAGEIAISLTNAQWNFAKFAATFYHQAKKDGDLDKYFSLVNKLYCDLWPEEGNEGTFANVRPVIFARDLRLTDIIQLRTHIIAAAISTVGTVPSHHWEHVLHVECGRAYRVRRPCPYLSSPDFHLAHQNQGCVHVSRESDEQNDLAGNEASGEEGNDNDNVVDDTTLLAFPTSFDPDWCFTSEARRVYGPLGYVCPPTPIIPHPGSAQPANPARKTRMIWPSTR